MEKKKARGIVYVICGSCGRLSTRYDSYTYKKGKKLYCDIECYKGGSFDNWNFKIVKNLSFLKYIRHNNISISQIA